MSSASGRDSSSNKRERCLPSFSSSHRESVCGGHSNTTTTIIGVVQCINFGLNACLPLGDGGVVDAYELGVGRPELGKGSNGIIGGTVEGVVTLPKGSEI